MRKFLYLLTFLFGACAQAATVQGPLQAQNALAEIAANGSTAQASARTNIGAASTASPTFTGTVTIPTGSVLNTPASINLTNGTALPYTALPSLSANQLLGSLTATTPSGQSVPSCSAAGDALSWTSGTGFGCFTGYAPLANPVFTGSFNAATGATFGTVINSGATTFLTAENVSSAPGTAAVVLALTGGADFAELINLDGTTPTAFLESSSGDTGGLVIMTNAGPIVLASNTVFTGTTFSVAHTLFASTAPTVASGFGTSPSIAANNGTAAFAVTIGTSPGSSGVLTLPAAADGWACDATDITTQSASVFLTKETTTTTTTVTLTQYNDAAAATPWVAGDKLLVKCSGY